MSKQSGINKEFLRLTALFYQEYYETSKDVGTTILFGRIVGKKLIEEKIAAAVAPIIDDYFKASIAASNKIVSAEVSKLTTQLDVPFKYNKTLLDSINEQSIFNGYYSTEGKSLFKSQEITKLKKTILSAKYGDWSEREMISGIKNVVNITDNHARVIARTETTRLNSVAKQIYYGKKAVRDKYNLVFHAKSDARPAHASYDGKIANEDGYFDGECGLIKGAPVPCSPFNCRCSVSLEPK